MPLSMLSKELSDKISRLEAFQPDPQKKTVCSLTLSSTNEANTFAEKLSPKDFQFVELEDYWAFNNACKRKIKCDILLISGHFGGSFFGHRGPSLKLSDLEYKSCDSGCDGIFKHPKEVFLFGSNTLAGKTKDHRSVEEYIEILMKEYVESLREGGFLVVGVEDSRVRAEEVASLRYSSIGHAFADRMTSVFSKTPRIYGFDSVSPSGRTIEPLLKKYLNERGDYASYFESIKDHENLLLQETLSHTTFTQDKGNIFKNVSSNQENLTCFLSDENIPFSSKIKTLQEKLKSKDRLQHLLSFFNYMERFNFFKNIDTFKNDVPFYDFNLFKTFSNNSGLKDEILPLLHKKSATLYVKLISFIVSHSLGWVSKSEASSFFKNILGGELGIAERDLLCSFKDIYDFDLRYEDIPRSYWSNPNFIPRDLACIKPQDPEIHKALVKVLREDENWNARYWSIEALKKIQPQDPEVHKALVKALLEDEDRDVRRWSAEILGLIKPQDPEIHKVLAKALLEDKNNHVRYHSALVLAHIQPQDPEIHKALAKALLEDKNNHVRHHSALVLAHIQPQDEDIRKALTKALLEDKSEYVRKDSAWALGRTQSQDPETHKALTKALLEDKSERVRKDSAWALGRTQSQDPEAHKVLAKALLEDEREDVRQTSAWALKEIKPQDPEIHKVLVKTLLEDKNEYIRSNSAEALGEIKSQDPRIHKVLVKTLLEDKNEYVRHHSAWALGKIQPQDPRIHQALTKALFEDKSVDVRRISAWALGEIKPQDPHIHKALAKSLLEDESLDVRYRSAWALGEIKSQDIDIHKVLVKILLEDKSVYVISNSAEALGKIKPQDPEIIKMIKEAFQKEESEYVRSQIKKALKAIEG